LTTAPKQPSASGTSRPRRAQDMTFGFLIFPGAEELDVVGPWEMIGVWSRRFGGPANRVVVSEKGGVGCCAGALRVVADYNYGDCPTLHCLLVPGGTGTRREVSNMNLLHFIRRRALTCDLIASVCTGSFILHAAGQLSGRRATTHAESLERLSRLSGVTAVRSRVVRDGKVWTSAGVSAGIDLALELIAHLSGSDIAREVLRVTEYEGPQ